MGIGDWFGHETSAARARLLSGRPQHPIWSDCQQGDRAEALGRRHHAGYPGEYARGESRTPEDQSNETSAFQGAERSLQAFKHEGERQDHPRPNELLNSSICFGFYSAVKMQ